MTLSNGAQLGPYQILDLLGAGGMGEVYRARDARLARDVAVKILPSSVARHEERLRRFEIEARAASALNHPNIVAVYDIGRTDAGPYVVSELLEGQSLRARLAEGPMPARKALDYAVQIAQGLAAAHEKGVVHRDLKPENLFITRDGHAKILDFGLAKLAEYDEAGSADSPTLTRGTEPGTVLGTAGYMAPEQVRGRPADHRSDVFSFGAVLYEMLTGQRAFKGDSAIEILNAILKDEPPDVMESGRNLPPGVDHVVRHCLEKRPEERFQSARDLAFDLQTLSGLSGSSPARRGRLRAPSRVGSRVAAGVGLLALLAAAFLVGRGTAPDKIGVEFQQVTFRRGAVQAARFAPDAGSFVYTAAWDGGPKQTFLGHAGSPDARSLELGGAVVRAVSANGDMAVTLSGDGLFNRLARVSLGGGALREIAESVASADWTRDGSDFAIVRWGKDGSRLEFPIGSVLHVSTGRISHARISPAGDRVAFIEHLLVQDDRGSIAVVDRAGNARTLSDGWASAEGLAWARDGSEVWFTAARRGARSELQAVSLSGRVRRLLTAPGRLVLHDVAADGRVLLAQNNLRAGVAMHNAGEAAERDLSWHDYSHAVALSADGRRLLFSESGEAGGERYGVYLRGTDGSPAVRLGEGRPTGLSPDGRWAVSIPLDAPPRITLLPTGPGQARTLASGKLEQYQWADFFPDGERLLILGNEPGRPSRLFVLELNGERLRAIAPEGVMMHTNTLSPDGRALLAYGRAGQIMLYPVEGGEPTPVRGLVAGSALLRWSPDGRALFVATPGPSPSRIEKLDLASGQRAPWKELAPVDRAGLDEMSGILLSADGQSYAYNYKRTLSDLFVVDGLR